MRAAGAFPHGRPWTLEPECVYFVETTGFLKYCRLFQGFKKAFTMGKAKDFTFVLKTASRAGMFFFGVLPCPFRWEQERNNPSSSGGLLARSCTSCFKVNVSKRFVIDQTVILCPKFSESLSWQQFHYESDVLKGAKKKPGSWLIGSHTDFLTAGAHNGIQLHHRGRRTSGCCHAKLSASHTKTGDRAFVHRRPGTHAGQLRIGRAKS